MNWRQTSENTFFSRLGETIKVTFLIRKLLDVTKIFKDVINSKDETNYGNEDSFSRNILICTMVQTKTKTYQILLGVLSEEVEKLDGVTNALGNPVDLRDYTDR